MRYSSGTDLLRQTPGFWEHSARSRLEKSFNRAYRYVEPLFGGTLANPPPAVRKIWDAAGTQVHPVDLALQLVAHPNRRSGEIGVGPRFHGPPSADTKA